MDSNVFSETERVIVRGFNSDWITENFMKMEVYFGESAVSIPAESAKLIGFYFEYPVSAISHIGIVNKIERNNTSHIYYLSAIIKLKNPIKTADGHPIRKHEYWTLGDLGLKSLSVSFL